MRVRPSRRPGGRQRAGLRAHEHERSRSSQMDFGARFLVSGAGTDHRRRSGSATGRCGGDKVGRGAIGPQSSWCSGRWFADCRGSRQTQSPPCLPPDPLMLSNERLLAGLSLAYIGTASRVESSGVRDGDREAVSIRRREGSRRRRGRGEAGGTYRDGRVFGVVVDGLGTGIFVAGAFLGREVGGGVWRGAAGTRNWG